MLSKLLNVDQQIKLRHYMWDHPWLTRVGLLGLINMGRGVALSIGVASGSVETVVAFFIALVTLLADHKIIKNGESKTTSMAHPRDDDGTILVRSELGTK